MVDYEKELESRLNNFFEKVTLENHFGKYEEFHTLILEYQNCLKKEEIVEYLLAFYKKNVLEEYKEDMLLEFENRLIGNCSPIKEINWGET